MGQAGTGLSRQGGKCAGKPLRINEIGPELVFRGGEDKCASNSNEISALGPELVFRQVPGKLVQWSGQPQRFGRRSGLCLALLDAVASAVVWIQTAPTGLCLAPTRGLTFWLAAGSLPGSHSWVWQEPPAADRARFPPGFWHGASSSPCDARTQLWIAWVILGKRTWGTLRARRSKLDVKRKTRRALSTLAALWITRMKTFMKSVLPKRRGGRTRRIRRGTASRGA